jgi:hypothetical protein
LGKRGFDGLGQSGESISAQNQDVLDTALAKLAQEVSINRE